MSRDILSASSSLSSLSSSRPQQHGLSSSHHDHTIRQTPPSASHTLWSAGRHTPYVTPQPLILDPSAASETSSSTEPPLRRASSVYKLLEAAAASGRKKQQQSPPSTATNTATSSDDDDMTAASFARTAPRAGFLSKLGTNIPQFKRRFFVLKPSTHLYYFLSPSDTEPRGCIDLDNATVEPLEHLVDGRCRFALNVQDKPPIILEARSPQVAQEWMESVSVERMSFVKQACLELEGENAQYKARIAELEQEVENYKLVEKDRDGALEDAANWKSQFERLNEGLRLLTQHLRRAPDSNDKEEEETMQEQATDQEEETTRDEEAADLPVADENDTMTPMRTTEKVVSTPLTSASHRETSLLDGIEDDEQQIDDLEFPGTNFSALLNACQQLRESLRLASVEASSAVEDLNAANERMCATDKRMSKAEKHICKLWEENCAMRKTIKQNKKEKRVLIKEVKSLMAVVNETSQKLRQASLPQDRSVRQEDDEIPDISGIEEERLIEELEEHVMSSIRLHEQFLGVNSGLADQLVASVRKIESGSYSDNDDFVRASPSAVRTTRTPDSVATVRIENHRPNTSVTSSTDTGESGRMSPIRPTLLALFDEDDSEEEESVYGDEESKAPSVISSVGAELGDPYDDTITEDGKEETTLSKIEEKRTFDQHDGSSIQSQSQIPRRVVSSSSSAFTPLLEDSDVEASDRSVSVTSGDASVNERKHPILQLDEEDSVAPNLCASSTHSESSKSITENGNATSRLFCPLADVVGTKRRKQQVVPGLQKDGQVYHLTFYSRKIGIQFQKVPAEGPSRGLLTAAMTTDLPSGGGKEASGSTAAELRRIAAISNLASPTPSRHKKDEVCQVATPVDAVLVCGFHGFDDQADQTRPKLGARLVAFDGISVEVGRWTFDSVRKAIQARGRPLTLSFRNDFLTTKQRAILTKAVADVKKAIPPPRPTIQYTQTLRPASTEPESIHSHQSHDTEQFVNDAHPCDDDDMSASVASSNRNTTRSSHSVGSYSNFRSFSDAGSSSVFSSTFGPLVGNLMTGLSKQRDASGVPSYLRSDAESLENAPYHQDFKSSLL